ncbi:MAG TPA: polysaccharide deacetylase family protein [Verrucomicrobiae bacterium]|nr:polysaccharide deacetylase family protein [Verrucomicrobiae bacterium]
MEPTEETKPAARPVVYYSGLAPFRETFQRGLPILTYHKLGPRPRGVRLKGLYLSARLFARQLAELREAGFQSGSLENWNAQAGRRIILTFDDGHTNVLEEGVEPLAQNRFRAIQFLPAELLGKTNQWDVAQGEVPEPIMDAAQVREWIASGHEIGSHTLTHPFLTRLTPDRAREEISASRKKLEDLFGRPVEHFCYPYGDWNPAVRDLVGESGYKTACTTDTGINQATDSPYSLKRFTARYPTRNLKSFWGWLSSRRREKKK